jgi:hypothetical protein
LLDKDILFTLAELGMALAGFSAIVGILKFRKGISDTRANSIRLQVMLETCFMVAAMALVPVLIDHFGINNDYLWRISSAIFLMIAIPFEFVARHRTRDMPKMTLSKLNINTINWGVSLSADLILVAVLFGLVGNRSEAFYLLALFAQLILAGNLFVQFAAETFKSLDE